MALKHPVDIAAWRSWEAGRHPLRLLKKQIRRNTPSSVWIASNGSNPVVGVLLESRAMSSRAAFLEPIAHLADLPVAVFASFDPTELVPQDWQVRQVPDLHLGRDFLTGQVLFGAGHYLGLGSAAYEQALTRGVSFVVAQHGLLTPDSPPLPPGAHVLAWSDADTAFWIGDRSDVSSTVVGSQLLWRAARLPEVVISPKATPVYLGQLHGAELPRIGMLRAAVRFCRTTHGAYRPHPSEVDHLSRLTHATFEGLGIDVDRSGRPLADLHRPVVAAYSTGVLEAAARGIPSYVFYPDAPPWLHAFWRRYGMRPWGGEPTPPPDQPAVEPAIAVAAHLRNLVT